MTVAQIAIVGAAEPPVGAGLPAMAFQKTTPIQRIRRDPIVGAGLLAKAVGRLVVWFRTTEYISISAVTAT
ncbi:hypothetical protein PspR76_05715 [Pseudomonas sp. R76]|nr:hypothetical protein PspR76_05715 [Pseudomonas sp. R76]